MSAVYPGIRICDRQLHRIHISYNPSKYFFHVKYKEVLRIQPFSEKIIDGDKKGQLGAFFIREEGKVNKGRFTVELYGAFFILRVQEIEAGGGGSR